MTDKQNPIEVEAIAQRLADLTLAGLDASARALSYAVDKIVGPEPTDTRLYEIDGEIGFFTARGVREYFNDEGTKFEMRGDEIIDDQGAYRGRRMRGPLPVEKQTTIVVPHQFSPYMTVAPTDADERDSHAIHELDTYEDAVDLLQCFNSQGNQTRHQAVAIARLVADYIGLDDG